MVKILVIGDPHFKPGLTLEGKQLCTEVEKLLNENFYDLTVVLGDVLDTFERMYLPSFDQAIEFLGMIQKYTMLVVLIGNHDRINNQEYLTTLHPFNSLKNWPNTIVVDKPCTLKFGEEIFGFAPYVPTGRFSEAIADIPDTVSAIFAHQEFKGAKMGAIISEHGDEWGLDKPLCVSGHIHQFDQLQPNLIYVGTPFQQSFNDPGTKAVMEFEFENGLSNMKRIELKIWKKKSVELNIEKFKKFVFEEETFYNVYLQGTLKEIQSLSTNPKYINIFQNDRIKIKIRNETEQLSTEYKKEASESFFETFKKIILSEDDKLFKDFEKMFL